MTRAESFDRWVNTWQELALRLVQVSEDYRLAHASAFNSLEKGTDTARKAHADAATSELRLKRNQLEVEERVAYHRTIFLRGSAGESDQLAVKFAAIWADAPSRHDLRPRVRLLAERLYDAVPAAQQLKKGGLSIDPLDVICGAIWELMEATKTEREPAEARCVIAGRKQAAVALRQAVEKALAEVERQPVLTSQGVVSP